MQKLGLFHENRLLLAVATYLNDNAKLDGSEKSVWLLATVISFFLKHQLQNCVSNFSKKQKWRFGSYLKRLVWETCFGELRSQTWKSSPFFRKSLATFLIFLTFFIRETFFERPCSKMFHSENKRFSVLFSWKHLGLLSLFFSFLEGYFLLFLRMKYHIAFFPLPVL